MQYFAHTNTEATHQLIAVGQYCVYGGFNETQIRQYNLKVSLLLMRQAAILILKVGDGEV